VLDRAVEAAEVVAAEMNRGNGAAAAHAIDVADRAAFAAVVGTIAGQRISFGGTANCSAPKAGLLGLTPHASYEVAPDRIFVSAVCLGPTATGLGGAVPSEEAKTARAQKILLGRMCEPEDVAEPILFLAGSAARMITGVVLTVDGSVLIKNDTPYDEYFRRR
jgi:NAD(P)-dependent dehydrogenase (short-subunit alcohol dehydrogenase family)